MEIYARIGGTYSQQDSVGHDNTPGNRVWEVNKQWSLMLINPHVTPLDIDMNVRSLQYDQSSLQFVFKDVCGKHFELVGRVNVLL